LTGEGDDDSPGQRPCQHDSGGAARRGQRRTHWELTAGKAAEASDGEYTATFSLGMGPQFNARLGQARVCTVMHTRLAPTPQAGPRLARNNGEAVVVEGLPERVV